MKDVYYHQIALVKEVDYLDCHHGELSQSHLFVKGLSAYDL